MIEVLKTSPNPAAHGVGTTSPRQGRLKPTGCKSLSLARKSHHPGNTQSSLVGFCTSVDNWLPSITSESPCACRFDTTSSELLSECLHGLPMYTPTRGPWLMCLDVCQAGPALLKAYPQ